MSAYTAEITIPMEPQPKRRVRASTRAGRVITYQDSKSRAFERAVSFYLRQFAPLKPIEGPIGMGIKFYHRRPRKLQQRTTRGQVISAGPHWKPTTPDLSNLIKAIEDSAQAAGIIGNDAQIAELQARDFYTERDREPRIELRIYELEALGGGHGD